MNLLWSTKSKINENENRENAPGLEITEAVLVYCNIVINNCQQNQEPSYIYS